jgi:pyruvate/2-oxoglutarate/acetoin dehydrogenase E1 component
MSKSPFNEAMRLLAAQPNAIFLGQNVNYDGNKMYNDLVNIPIEQRIEFPVAEELQMGTSIGLAIQGFFPVSIYPRFDFLMRAMDQLVNHLDKLELMSQGQFTPKVIIRTRVGGLKPLNAGPQHTQDYTEALRLMLTNIDVHRITNFNDILPTYMATIKSTKSALVVEALEC